MNDLEERVQKSIISFCKYLPQHVSKWNTLLEKSLIPTKTLANFAEQQRHIRKAEIPYLDQFSLIQKELEANISLGIDKEMAVIKDILNQLEAANCELKNKLSTLERLTTELDWKESSLLIRGHAYQPHLSRLLQDGLRFSTYFLNTSKTINSFFKMLNLEDEKSIKELQNSLQNVDLKNNDFVNYFLALTQFVGR